MCQRWTPQLVPQLPVLLPPPLAGVAMGVGPPLGVGVAVGCGVGDALELGAGVGVELPAHATSSTY
jgi:hypothetical protein